MLHYTLEDGLPSNTIYNIYQDPQGFIWLGTDKGVARYNGQKFETFTTADGLADNECFFFKPDFYGRLWIATYNGELCYYKDGKFHNAQNTPWLKLPYKAAGTIEIFQNKDSSILFTFNDDPGFLEIKNEKIIHHMSDLLNKKFKSLHCLHSEKNSAGDYEVFYLDERIVFDKKMKLKKRIHFSGVSMSFYGFSVDTGYYISSDSRVYTKNLENVPIPKIPPTNYIFKSWIKKGQKIIATNKGIYINDTIPLLPDLTIFSFFYDQNGYYWIGTAKNGLYRLSKSYKDIDECRQAFNETIIFAERKRNYLFFATKDRTISRIKTGGNLKEVIFDGEKYALDNKKTSAQFILNESFFNFSHANDFRIDNIFAPIPTVHKVKIGNIYAQGPTVYSQNRMYFKSRYSLFDCDYTQLLKLSDTIVSSQIKFTETFTKIYGIASGPNQELWVSNLNGVYKFKDRSAIPVPQFGNISFRDFIFFNDYIVGYTHHNNLLVCSDYNSNKIKIDTIKNQDCVWDKFYKVNDSVILISTNNYFRILSFHSHAKEKYTLRVLETPFIPYQPEFTYIDSSKCYFFKNGSISSFPIAYVLEQKPPPTVEFLSLKTSRKSYIIKKSVSLDYFEARDINILFTAVSFFNKNLSYEYSVSTGNKTDSWIKIDGGELNLFKLGFGNFTVKIRAKTLSGDYSAPVSFNLNIARPYWATWWFLSICGLGVVLLIAYAARIGIRRSLKKKEGEVRFLRSEYKALNALMNPHFIFNSLNSVQSLVNNNENTRASKYIRIFSDLIRQNMSNISNDLISLSKEMSLVENYLRIEQLRFKDKLEYEINIDEDVESEMIMIPPLLIQPLVENSIKHGIWPKKVHDGHISISIYEKGDLLFVEIEDNGVGINSVKSSDTLHESYAMSNIHKRIEQLSVLHQTKIEVKLDNRTDAGGNIIGAKAVITIYIPSGV